MTGSLVPLCLFEMKSKSKRTGLKNLPLVDLVIVANTDTQLSLNQDSGLVLLLVLGRESTVYICWLVRLVVSNWLRNVVASFCDTIKIVGMV